MKHIVSSLVTLFALTMLGCQSTARQTEEMPPLAWPEAPEPARVRFVRTLTQPDDLGIAKDFFSRLGDLIFGGREERLIRPMAVVAADGEIFVADPGAGGVHRFDNVNGRYTLVQLAEGRALVSPVGLALSKGGNVYVTDSRLAAVFVIRKGKTFAEPLSLSSNLQQPTGIAVDAEKERIFVVDTLAHCVRVFSASGALLQTIGKRGKETGAFNFPTYLWYSSGDGRLYVTDSLNFRIQVFDVNGSYLGMFGRHGDGAGDSARQKGVATDRAGHVYVADAFLNALQIFDAQGQFLLSIGALGQDRGEFWLPAGVFIDAQQQIYIADAYNRRVQIFQYVGEAQ